MPTHSLPERPNLRHLKDQAKDLLESGAAKSIADAQFNIAKQYGFPSWPKLKAHIASHGRSTSTRHHLERGSNSGRPGAMCSSTAIAKNPLTA